MAKFEAEIARATTDVAGELAEGQAALVEAAVAGDFEATERLSRELRVLQGQTTQSNYTWCPPPARRPR